MSVEFVVVVLVYLVLNYRAIADPTFAKKGRRRASYPTWELAIFVNIVLIHPYIFLLNTFIALIGFNVLPKSACQNVYYCGFYATLKIAKNGSRMSSFFQIFTSKHFPIKNWNFLNWGTRPPLPWLTLQKSNSSFIVRF